MSVLKRLSEDECLALLGQSILGRLGVTIHDYPMIFPVNYAMDGATVVFRTDPGAKLDAARCSNVTFEVDAADLAHRTGWSVLVLGKLRVVPADDDVELLRTSNLKIDPLAPGAKAAWVQIVPSNISGRLIENSDLGFAFDARGYI